MFHVALKVSIDNVLREEDYLLQKRRNEKKRSTRKKSVSHIRIGFSFGKKFKNGITVEISLYYSWSPANTITLISSMKFLADAVVLLEESQIEQFLIFPLELGSW